MEEFKRQLNKTARQLTQKVNRLEDKKKNQVVYRAVLLSVYGWQLAIPVLLGIMLGLLLDNLFPIKHFSWFFNLMILGFIAGFYNATQWMKKNLGLRDKKNDKH